MIQIMNFLLNRNDGWIRQEMKNRTPGHNNFDSNLSGVVLVCILIVTGLVVLAISSIEPSLIRTVLAGFALLL